MLRENMLEMMSLANDQKKLDYLFDSLSSLFEDTFAFMQLRESSQHAPIEAIQRTLEKNGIVGSCEDVQELLVSMEGLLEGLGNMISKICDGIVSVFNKIFNRVSDSSRSSDVAKNASDKAIAAAVETKHNIPDKDEHKKILEGFNKLLELFVLGIKDIVAGKEPSFKKLFEFGEFSHAPVEAAPKDRRSSVEKELDKDKEDEPEEKPEKKGSKISIKWSVYAKELFKAIHLEPEDEATFYEPAWYHTIGFGNKRDFDMNVKTLDFNDFEEKSLANAGYGDKAALEGALEHLSKVRGNFSKINESKLIPRKMDEIKTVAKKAVDKSGVKVDAEMLTIVTRFSQCYARMFRMLIAHFLRYDKKFYSIFHLALNPPAENEDGTAKNKEE